MIAGNLALRCLLASWGGQHLANVPAAMARRMESCVPTRVTAEDFLAALLATLAKRGWAQAISIRGDRFDAAAADAFDVLRSTGQQLGLDVRFFVMPHPRYGESTVMRDAIARLAQWDLLSLDNPEYQVIRLKISPEYADQLLTRLALPPSLLAGMADAFVRSYEGSSATVGTDRA
jgi:hypothetical protein